jgi:hypothetical protein
MDIKVILTSATNRTEVITSNTKTPREVLTDNNVATTGQTFHLNGVPLSQTEMDDTFVDLLDGADEAFIVAVPAQKAGC